MKNRQWPIVTVPESIKSRSCRNVLHVKHVSPPYQTLDCTSGWNCSTKVRKYIRVSCFDITQLFPMITFSSIHWKPWFALTWIFREVWNLVLTFLDRNNLRIYYPLYCTAKLSKRCSTRDKSKYTLNLKLEKVAPPIVQNSAISTPPPPFTKKSGCTPESLFWWKRLTGPDLIFSRNAFRVIHSVEHWNPAAMLVVWFLYPIVVASGKKLSIVIATDFADCILWFKETLELRTLLNFNSHQTQHLSTVNIWTRRYPRGIQW